MRIWAFLLVLTPTILSAQGLTADEKDYSYPEFRECGLVTRFSPAKIPPNCLTKALNVYFDDDFTTSRRRGYSQFNSTVCGTGIVSGMWNFDSVGGVAYIALQVGASFYYTTTAGGCTQITGLNAINTTNPLECVQAIGELWCVNGVDTAFSWDGSTVAYHYTLPLGTMINTFRNRIVVANISGDPARIKLSGEGDGDDWHVETPGASTSPTSIAISGLEDGKAITGLLGQYQNAFEVGRVDDLYALGGNDRRDFTLRQISSQIGVKDKRTVREKDNCLIWLSNRGVEKQCGSSIDRISDNIKANIDEIILSAGNTRTRNFDTQAQWEAGSYKTQVANYGPTSTTISPGSVVPSSWGATGSFNDGELIGVDSRTVSASLILNYSSATAFWWASSPDATLGPKWSTNTAVNSADTLTINSVYGIRYDFGYTDLTGRSVVIRSSPTNNAETGVFSAQFYYRGIWQRNIVGGQQVRYSRQPSLDYYFISDSSDIAVMNGYGVRIQDTIAQDYVAGDQTYPVHRAYLVKMVAGKETILSTSACAYTEETVIANEVINTNLSSSMTIIRDGGGYMSVAFQNSVCGAMSGVSGGDTSYQNNYMLFRGTSTTTLSPIYNNTTLTNIVAISTIYYSSGGYVGQGDYTGRYTSSAFDTTFSTPTAGYFEATDAIYAGSTVTYSLRGSTGQVSGSPHIWTDWIVTGTDSFRVPFNHRHWQYRFTYDTDVASITPVVDFPVLKAQVTGYYITDCIDTGGGTSVGTFRPVTTLSGANKAFFFVSTGTTCNSVVLDSANWTAQTVNAPITLGTAAYTGVQAVLQPYASTDSTKLDGLTLEWYEGDRPPLGSAVYKDRYYLFYTTSTDDGVENNNALVYDLNNVWTMLDDVFAYSSVVHNTKLYTGDSRGNGIINQQDIGLFDIENSAGIIGNARKYIFNIKTNDYDFGNAVEKKQLRRVYLMLKSGSNSDETVNLTLKYYVNGSTTAHTFTPNSNVYLSESGEPGLFVAKFPAPVQQEVTFNWLSLELDYTGDQGPLSLLGIKVVYKPLRWE